MGGTYFWLIICTLFPLVHEKRMVIIFSAKSDVKFYVLTLGPTTNWCALSKAASNYRQSAANGDIEYSLETWLIHTTYKTWHDRPIRRRYGSGRTGVKMIFCSNVQNNITSPRLEIYLLIVYFRRLWQDRHGGWLTKYIPHVIADCGRACFEGDPPRNYHEHRTDDVTW